MRDEVTGPALIKYPLANCLGPEKKEKWIVQGMEREFQYNDPFITCITIKSSYSFSILPYHNPISS